MAVGNFRDQGPAAAEPAASPRHIGFGPRFIDKDETCRVNPALVFFPANAAASDVRAILFGGEQSFF